MIGNERWRGFGAGLVLSTAMRDGMPALLVILLLWIVWVMLAEREK